MNYFIWWVGGTIPKVEWKKIQSESTLPAWDIFVPVRLPSIFLGPKIIHSCYKNILIMVWIINIKRLFVSGVELIEKPYNMPKVRLFVSGVEVIDKPYNMPKVRLFVSGVEVIDKPYNKPKVSSIYFISGKADICLPLTKYDYVNNIA